MIVVVLPVVQETNKVLNFPKKKSSGDSSCKRKISILRDVKLFKYLNTPSLLEPPNPLQKNAHALF